MNPPPGASNVYPMQSLCRFLPHSLFLLPIRRMPNRSESHRRTRGVVSWSLVGSYLLGDINNNDINWSISAKISNSVYQQSVVGTEASTIPCK